MSVYTIQETLARIKRGISEIISEDELRLALESSAKAGRPLRLKAGFDPTAPDIHLGHTVLLRKLRQFQDLGHIVLFLIGDFTAQIGDPSGRDQKRPRLSRQEIRRNTATYAKQAFKILDPKRTRVVFNSSWLGKMKVEDFLKLTSYASVAQLLARADFKQRFEQQKEISLLEFIYPLLQAYDSVYLKADIEFGGTDQKFNLLMGRQLQALFNQKPQIVIMTPLLEGTDGIQKMSKTLNNYIGITESAREIFGKAMSISDPLMMRYYELLTDIDCDSIKSDHPKVAKMNLAEMLVQQYYGERIAKKERVAFERVFAKGEVPTDIPVYTVKAGEPITIVKVLVDSGLAASGNEARRLIKQGAVSFDAVKVTDELWQPKAGVIKIGKHKFLRILQS